MLKVKLFLTRMVFWIGLILRYYPIWSKLHRILFDRAAKDTQLPTFANTEEILPFLRGFVWRPDSWIDLGDAMCSAEMVWYRHLNSVDHKIGDCDEFAVFLACVIQKSIEDGVWKSNIEDPDIMSVMWMDGDGTVAGHNVCLLKLGVCYGYMDYDVPRWCGGKPQVAAAVLKRYAGADAQPVAWCIHSTKLKLREFFVP